MNISSTKVQYNSLYKTHISQKLSGSDTPDPLLELYSIHNSNKRLVNNLCISLNEVKLFFFNIIHIKLIYCTASIFVALHIINATLFHLPRKCF